MEGCAWTSDERVNSKMIDSSGRRLIIFSLVVIEISCPLAGEFDDSFKRLDVQAVPMPRSVFNRPEGDDHIARQIRARSSRGGVPRETLRNAGGERIADWVDQDEPQRIQRIFI